MKLFNQYRKYILMDADPGAGGGGAGGSLITSPEGGNGAGGGGSGDSAGGGDSGKGGDSNAGKSASGGSAADWRSTLPKELQDNETLKKYSSVSDLAGAYVNASKLIGGDKLPIPNPKTATAADWENVWNKLGRPALDKYELKFKDGVTIDKEFSEQFKQNAHKAGLLPQQAQALADWFSDLNTGVEQKVAAQTKAQFDKQVGELRGEWGSAFDAKIGRVNKMLQDMGAAKYFQEKGYGSDPMIFKYLDYAAERLYKEHKLLDPNGGAGGKQVRTPNEIKAAIAKMQTDVAYLTKDHPGHKIAVEEMAALHQELHPVDKK